LLVKFLIKLLYVNIWLVYDLLAYAKEPSNTMALEKGLSRTLRTLIKMSKDLGNEYPEIRDEIKREYSNPSE
jgi:hypothetical protein